MRVPTALLVAASFTAGTAAAAPIDSPLPGGLTALLRVEVNQAGSPARSLMLDLPVTSEPSGPVNGLAEEGLTAGQKASWDHRNKVLTENTPDPEEYTRVWAALAKACDAHPNSAACARAQEGVQAHQAKLDAANVRAEAQLAAGPSMDVDNHRFQKWGGNPDRGCGSVVSRIGGKAHQLSHQTGQPLTVEAVMICSSELVLDRRTGRAFLKVNPLIYFAPGDRAGTFDLDALHRSAPNVKVEPGGQIGSPPHAIIRELKIDGDLDAFKATAQLPARTGAPLNVRIEFRRDE